MEKLDNCIYYIDINEIPSEHSCESIVFSQVKMFKLYHWLCYWVVVLLLKKIKVK